MTSTSTGPRPTVPSGVTVVVMSRDRRVDLLASLPRHEAPVVFVDNGSSDGSVGAVRQAHPDVAVLPLERNVGARARTLGAERAGTDFVAFADDDSWWAPGDLARAAAIMRAHPRLAVLNARILVGPEQRPDPVCAEMARSPLGTAPDLPGPSLLGFVACGAMVRTEAFLSVGGFDSVVRFPGEEERLSLDLAAAGWGLAYVDAVTVHHHPSVRRHDPAARRTAIWRSKLLTAVLRLPAAEVAGVVLRALRAGAPERRGLLRALPDLPAALRRRRRTPDAVLAQRRLLEGGPEAGSACPTTAAPSRVPPWAAKAGGTGSCHLQEGRADPRVAAVITDQRREELPVAPARRPSAAGRGNRADARCRRPGPP